MADHTDHPARALTSYLCTPRLAEAIDWYAEVYGAEEVTKRYMMDDGRIGHCELRFDDSMVYMAEPFPEMGIVGPDRDTGSVVSLMLAVDDPDAVFDRAVSAGAEVDRAMTDTDHGRIGWLFDPFGHRWGIGSR